MSAPLKTSDPAAKPSRPLAVTMGDPAGIGGEIILKAWTQRRKADLSAFFAIDDPQRLTLLARQLDLAVPIQAIADPSECREVFASALPVLPQALCIESHPGVAEPGNAPAVLASIDRAVALAQDGAVSGLVTNPINKAVLYDAGFRHPGHTEYLASLTDPTANRGAPVMMLAAPQLKVVPVTIHLALGQAVASLTREKIVHCALTTAAALSRDFAIDGPRLAVAGLNPHAGEAGMLGREEIEIIAPAIEQLRGEGLIITDPAAADSLFHAAAREAYDVALCMYHDQALIPLKTLAFDEGVNVTLGLPVIRTSPDHGTAFDIAGKGLANPSSLIAALAMATSMARNRARHDNAS